MCYSGDFSLLELNSLQVQIEKLSLVKSYLCQFPDLLSVVPMAVNAAKKYFPEDQLVMDLYQDPEISDCYIVLYVRLRKYDDSVVERLEKAEAEFLSHLANKKGWIQLTIDFVSPDSDDIFD